MSEVQRYIHQALILFGKAILVRKIVISGVLRE